jgi:DHA1 family multidrug resistance protein-like MFS transporter
MDQWKKNLYVLWGIQFLAMIGMNLVVPFLPFFIRSLGVSDDNELARWSGMVFAAPFLSAFVATPFWGSMGDRHGRKLMVIRAIFGLGIAQVLVGLSQDVYQLLLFRFFQGAVSGFISAALALVSTSTPKEKIGYALGFLQSATAGGTVLGPPIGGFLADLIDYHYIFFISATLCCTGGFVIIKYIQEAKTEQTPGPKPSVLQNFRFMFTNPQLQVIGFTIVLSQAAALMIEPIFALFIEQFKTDMKYLSTIIGIIFAISGIFMVFSAPWWGRRNDRTGFKTTLIIALTGTGTAYGLHMIVPGLFTLGLLRAGLGFARGGILHTLFALTNLHAPSDRKSGLIGIASSLAILGNTFGPLTGGMVAEHFGITSVFAVNSLLFFTMAYVIWKYLAEVRSSEHIDVKDAVEMSE